MGETEFLTNDELVSRATRFYSRYGGELEKIKELLNIRLEQIALAYTIQNNLPPEAVVVSSRVKTLKIFLAKLEQKGWPQFYYPTEVAQDLIGARVVCWFVDDCTGMMSLLKSSKHMHAKKIVKNYIDKPKPSGYRSIHMQADVVYDSVRRTDGSVQIKSDKLTCEIQIRTKLQDAWGDLTHEFHYKAVNAGIQNDTYEKILAEIAQRLANEDKSLITLRDAYRSLADDKQVQHRREGFREG